jgi:hypothetical protein
MLRFKQFLIENVTITPRQHLQAVYGNENAEKMIKSIQNRDKTDGGFDDWKTLRSYGSNSDTKNI